MSVRIAASFRCVVWAVTWAALVGLLGPVLPARAAGSASGAGDLAGLAGRILRLDPGHHTQPITSLAADPAGQALWTLSPDRSLRQWDLRDGGNLVRTVWLPAATEVQHLRFLSPSASGAQLLVTGALRSSLVVEPRTGLIKRINDEFVAPGRATAGWAVLPHAVREPPGSPYGVHYLGDGPPLGIDRDAQGRIVKSHGDRVCLYTAALLHVAEIAPEPGLSFGGVRFSPDGQLVAVGYVGVPRVDVRAGADLRLLYRADTADLQRGDLQQVAFSADGQVLYAGGSARGDGGVRLRRFPRAGHGPPADVYLGPGEITDLAALPSGAGGEVAVATSAPAWAVVSGAGAGASRGVVSLLRRGPAGNARAGRLRVDATGDRVWFPLGDAPDSGVEFSISQHRLRPAARPDPSLRPAATTHPEVVVQDWYDERSALINGRTINLMHYDGVARSLALDPAGQILLGSDVHIYRLARDRVLQLPDGAEASVSDVQAGPPVALDSAAVAVNLSGDGRALVAALRDGTIRWYRAADGQPLLSLFVDGQRGGRRWVLYLPGQRGGFYDASVGGEDLIGWLLERDGDRVPDFVPAAQLRRDFYRPDVVERVLTVGDPWRALAQRNDQIERERRGEVAGAATEETAAPAGVRRDLPPLVRILEPADGEAAAGWARLRVAVRSPGRARLVTLRALLNGRPALAEAGVALPPTGDEILRELRVPLGAARGEVLVSVLAETDRGAGPAVGVRVLAGVRGDASPAPAAPAPGDGVDLRPRLYVLAVGIGAYRQPDLRLRYPRKDATDLAAVLTAQAGAAAGHLYRGVEVRLLTDEAADRRGVLGGLQWLRQKTTDRDVAVIFLAGHGIEDPSTGRYFFVPHDGDLGQMLATMVPDAVLRETLAELPGKVLLFVDTCHAGRVFADRSLRGAERPGWRRFVNELASADSGVVVFAATTGRQAAQEDRQWDNGAFTKAVLEGLRGQADPGRTGRVTLNMLDLYISERVKTLTDGGQTPTTAKPSTIPDYPLALTGPVTGAAGAR